MVKMETLVQRWLPGGTATWEVTLFPQVISSFKATMFSPRVRCHFSSVAFGPGFAGLSPAPLVGVGLDCPCTAKPWY